MSEITVYLRCGIVVKGYQQANSISLSGLKLILSEKPCQRTILALPSLNKN